MNITEARELNKTVAAEIMTMISMCIRKAAEEGAMKLDYRIQDDMDDIYDYIIIPEFEKKGYNVATFSSSSSEINNGANYRTLRICWHPKP
jgi:hypothetical protein